MTKNYDLIVIGGGPGGIDAALEAKRMGLHTLVIEKKFIGGTCLNTGCIPTKTLLKTSRLYAHISKAGNYGIKTSQPVLDWPSLMQRKQMVIDQLRKAAELSLSKNKIEILFGEASFQNENEISVRTNDGVVLVSAKNILIASGSEPMKLPEISMNQKDILSSTEILNLPQMPRSIMIIGAGAIGIEFASFFGDLGITVSVVEMQNRILPLEDADCANRLETILCRKGIQILTDTKILGVDSLETGGIKVKLSNGENLQADILLVAIGRKRISRSLNLEKANVQVHDNGAIQVNSYLETTQPGIYAIGDVILSPQLAHIASYEGVCAVRNILGQRLLANYSAIPSCVYSYPEVMRVGYVPQNETDKSKYVEIKIPFLSNSKSVAEGDSDGFLKLVSSLDGRLAGAAAVGAHVTELIPELTLAIRLQLHVKELAESVHAHPTEAEIIQIAARELLSRLKS